MVSSSPTSTISSIPPFSSKLAIFFWSKCLEKNKKKQKQTKWDRTQQTNKQTDRKWVRGKTHIDSQTQCLHTGILLKTQNQKEPVRWKEERGGGRGRRRSPNKILRDKKTFQRRPWAHSVLPISRWAWGLPLRAVCIPSKTAMEKVNFSFASI